MAGFEGSPTSKHDHDRRRRGRPPGELYVPPEAAPHRLRPAGRQPVPAPDGRGQRRVQAHRRAAAPARSASMLEAVGLGELPGRRYPHRRCPAWPAAAGGAGPNACHPARPGAARRAVRVTGRALARQRPRRRAGNPPASAAPRRSWSRTTRTRRSRNAIRVAALRDEAGSRSTPRTRRPLHQAHFDADLATFIGEGEPDRGRAQREARCRRSSAPSTPMTPPPCRTARSPSWCGRSRSSLRNLAATARRPGDLSLQPPNAVLHVQPERDADGGRSSCRSSVSTTCASSRSTMRARGPSTPGHEGLARRVCHDMPGLEGCPLSPRQPLIPNPPRCMATRGRRAP